jgi:hypothetical protein
MEFSYCWTSGVLSWDPVELKIGTVWLPPKRLCLNPFALYFFGYV